MVSHFRQRAHYLWLGNYHASLAASSFIPSGFTHIGNANWRCGFGHGGSCCSGQGSCSSVLCNLSVLAPLRDGVSTHNSRRAMPGDNGRVRQVGISSSCRWCFCYGGEGAILTAASALQGSLGEYKRGGATVGL